jgi:hypothetical protein
MVRQTVPALFVISMAVASAMLVGSGFNSEVGVGIDLGLDDYADNLREQAHQDPSGSVIGGALTLIGLAIAAVDIVVKTFVWVYAFPLVLQNIGFPVWFYTPVGLPIWFVNLYGTAEIVRGMRMG